MRYLIRYKYRPLEPIPKDEIVNCDWLEFKNEYALFYNADIVENMEIPVLVKQINVNDTDIIREIGD